MSRTFIVIAVIVIAVIILFFIGNYQQSSPETAKSQSLLESAVQANIKKNWHEYTPASKAFKVFLPGRPQEVTDRIFDPATGEWHRYTTIIAASPGGTAFMLSVITFHHSPTEKDLKDMISDILARKKTNKLHYIRETTFQNAPALDFSISSGEVQILGKVFARGNEVYVLSMIGNVTAPSKQEYDYFMNSFSIEIPTPPEKVNNK